MPVINIPGVGNIQFPDSMSREEISAAAKKLYDDAAGIAPAEQAAPAQLEAVMLDTLDMPSRGQAITRAALAAGSAILGLVLLLFSLPGREGGASEL